MKRADYRGKKFNMLTIYKDLDDRVIDGMKFRYVEAICECGNHTQIALNDVVCGRVKHCGCLSEEEESKREERLEMEHTMAMLQKFAEERENGKGDSIMRMEDYRSVKREAKYKGQRYGNLVVEGQKNMQDYHKKTVELAECRCDCGNLRVVRLSDLLEGKVTDCGCSNLNTSKKRYITYKEKRKYWGKKFGQMTVISDTFTRISLYGNKSKYVKCRCDCGNTKDVRLCLLVKGQIQDCGHRK